MLNANEAKIFGGGWRECEGIAGAILDARRDAARRRELSCLRRERCDAESMHEAYDFVIPIAYIMDSEPATVRRSGITKDLKHDQLREPRMGPSAYVYSGAVHDQIKSPLVPSIRWTV